MKHATEKVANSGMSSEFIKTYTTDLAQKQNDPIIGRDKETEKVIEILGRKNKSCPVLVGLAGVGKTAVVEGLVQRIKKGDVPQFLKEKTIRELELGMLSGQDALIKLQILLEELPSDTILFIDEIHTIVGAGRTSGALDAANLLKPLLARGELKLIGATTPEEYRCYIEKDSALDRRFQSVEVNEPSIDDAMKILSGLKERYEKHHQIQISQEAIESAVNLAKRFLTDRQLPDSALDLLDQSCSKLAIDSEQTRFVELEIERQKDLGNLEKACELQYGILPSLQTETILKEKHVTKALSSWKNIPVEEMTSSEAQKLLNLRGYLQEKVLGQDDALETLCGRIQSSKVGLGSKNRPKGSFLLLGPTGVGKTETAKAVAEFLFSDPAAIIRFDMSEFMEKHSISKLIGAPAGYVGYEEGGLLTNLVKRKPYSVILMDEIEKAHPDVFNLFLQILDEGHLTDSFGVKVDFKNTYIFFTSNLNEESLKQEFRPEFINRIDEILTFKTLTHEVVRELLEREISKLQSQLLNERGIRFSITDSLKEALCSKGYDLQFGARPLKRLIHTKIERVLSELILKGEISSESFVVLKE